jgi:predicted dehydrogenase
MSSKRYNIGVIGYGLSAKVFHIPLILTVPDFKLHAIVQRSPKPDDNAEKDHPGVKVWRSADEMVTDEGLDVVVVTTAPDTHPSLAKLALEAGKHGMSQRLCKLGK